MRSILTTIGLAVLVAVVAGASVSADPFQNHLGRYELLDLDKATATPTQSPVVRVHDRIRRPVAIRVRVNVSAQAAYPVSIYARCSGRGDHKPFVIDEVVPGYTAHSAVRRFLRHASTCRVHAAAEVQNGEAQIRLFAWLKRS